MAQQNWFVKGDRVMFTEDAKRSYRSFPAEGYPVTEGMLNEVYVVTETTVSSAKDGFFRLGIPHIKIDSDMNMFYDRWIDSIEFCRAK